MSTDSSRDIACRYGARIVDIPEGSFDHGLTRNIGIREASGDLLYYTVQDAWIAENDMLEKMAGHFEDVTVMGVMGHQAVPHEKDKNPVLWYRPCSPPGITEKRIENTEVFEALPGNEQRSLVSWDDVVAMYRKSALEKQPFVETAYAEDWIWSYTALLKGWKLLHDSSLVVYHYHHQSFRYVFNATYTLNYHCYKFFKFKPSLPRVLLPVVRASYHLMKNKKLSFKEKLYWIIHNASASTANYYSIINFLARLKAGGEPGVEKGYMKFCKSIPQGKQRGG